MRISIPTSDTVLRFLAAYLLIFISGSMRFNDSPDKILLVVFCIAAALLLFKVKKIDPGFIVYFCAFLCGLLLVWWHTSGSLSFSSVVGTALKLVTAYALVVFLRERFVETTVQVIYFLALVSLFGFATDAFNLLTPVVSRLPVVGDGMAYEGFLYGFRDKVHLPRNNSIFYEPGAFQLYLNAALYAVFFFLNDWDKKRRIKYLVVLLVAVATTQSTTAYLMVALILAVALAKTDVINLRQKLSLALAVGVVVAVFSATFYKTVVVKINDYLDIQAMTDSSNRRSFDPLIDLEIIKRDPLGVGYDNYKRQFSVIGQIEEGAGSSNGVTRLFAIYGVPFGVFLLVSYGWFFPRCLGLNVVSLLGGALFIMALWSQSYFMFAPICMALIASHFIFRASRARFVLKKA